MEIFIVTTVAKLSPRTSEFCEVLCEFSSELLNFFITVLKRHYLSQEIFNITFVFSIIALLLHYGIQIQVCITYWFEKNITYFLKINFKYSF